MAAELRQAVILAAGRGQRLGPLGRLMPKVALPVGNRPLYAHHLDMLAASGVREVLMVMARNGEHLREAITAHAEPLLRVRFVTQQEPAGIAHALGLCAGELDDRFVVLLGDTWLQLDTLRPAVHRLESEGLAAVLSVREEPRPEVIRRECTIRVDAAGRVTEIHEKSPDVLGELKPCGLYFFTREILDAIDRLAPSQLRGELELTDAIGILARETGRVGVAEIVDFDVNITAEGDLLAANMKYLSLSNRRNLVASTARVSDSAEIFNSVIGPGAVVADGAKVRDSLLLAGARLGRNASARGAVLYADEARSLP